GAEAAPSPGRTEFPGAASPTPSRRSAPLVAPLPFARFAGPVIPPNLQVNIMTIPSDYVRFIDTTWRDGEQSPGATMTSEEKLEVARTLSRLGVDVIEAGFPAASPDDLAAVRQIAETVGQVVPDGRPERPDANGNWSHEPPIIAGLART